MTEREQRLVFGEVADTYDRVRPTYPDELVSDVLTFAGVGPGDRALEIGAGTGRATVLFAARGLAVTALEPSSEMADVCRQNVVSWPDVRVEESLFEDWAGGDGYSLIYAAQAWHWVPPDVRVSRAADLLAGGGALAVFWNAPDWSRLSGLRSLLDPVYDEHAPELPVRGPGSTFTEAALIGDEHVTEIDGSGKFTPVERREYPHRRTLRTADYLALLGTQSDHRLLADDHRARLLGAVGRVIDGLGGTVTVEYLAALYLARRRRD